MIHRINPIATRRARRGLGLAVLLGALLALALPAPNSAASDFKLAPPDSVLDARREDWIGHRRFMAVLIVGGTFVAGMAGSVIRRRQRRRDAARAQESPSE